MQRLPAAAKAAIVAVGYAVAILSASCVVWIHIDGTSGPERASSSGMYGFGDLLLFIAVFGVVSLAPTGAALYFLRQIRVFWLALAIAAVLVASTALAAIAVTVFAPESVNSWATLSFPRIFLSPYLASVFGLSGLLAPQPEFRRLLLAAAGAEFASSLFGFWYWFALLFFR